MEQRPKACNCNKLPGLFSSDEVLKKNCGARFSSESPEFKLSKLQENPWYVQCIGELSADIVKYYAARSLTKCLYGVKLNQELSKVLVDEIFSVKKVPEVTVAVFDETYGLLSRHDIPVFMEGIRLDSGAGPVPVSFNVDISKNITMRIGYSPSWPVSKTDDIQDHLWEFMKRLVNDLKDEEFDSLIDAQYPGEIICFTSNEAIYRRSKRVTISYHDPEYSKKLMQLIICKIQLLNELNEHVQRANDVMDKLDNYTV